MLASDLNNPEFLNPTNPDAMLHVEFYWAQPVDKWASDVAGKEVLGEKRIFVRIMRPGDNTSIIETPVRDDHKARWPHKWLAWQMKEGLIEGDQNIPGWKIEDWDVVKQDQIHELKYLRFNTVEQLAGASDAQIQRLGMGGIGLRTQAQQALKDKSREGVKAELEAKDAEIQAMRERLEAIENRLQDTQGKPKKVLSPEHLEKLKAGRLKAQLKKAEHA